MYNFQKLVAKLRKRLTRFKGHELTSEQPYSALWRYIVLNVAFLVKKRTIFSWVYGLKLILEKGDAGLVGNVYYGLYEYTESLFLLHFLRQEDTFLDVGANMGHYSILTAGVIKNSVIAVEPLIATFQRLEQQIEVNELKRLVTPINYGVSDKKGILYLSNDRGVMNQIVDESYPNRQRIEVDTIDNLTTDREIICIKIDVEGYELKSLKGAHKKLTDVNLKVVITELNDAGKKYSVLNSDVVTLLNSYGFMPYKYIPIERRLERLKDYDKSQFNTIFIRDMEFVTFRIKHAPQINVMGHSI